MEANERDDEREYVAPEILELGAAQTLTQGNTHEKALDTFNGGYVHGVNVYTT